LKISEIVRNDPEVIYFKRIFILAIARLNRRTGYANKCITIQMTLLIKLIKYTLRILYI